MSDVLVIPEQERQIIEAAYQDMLSTVKSMDEEDRRNIQAAFELAVEAHSHQRRKSGEPYILHPIAVAKICTQEIGLGPTAVIAALLHDVVEDTPISLGDIRVKFGDRIADIVDGLTKLDSAYNNESPQAENFKKVLSTLVEDVRVVLIKMADRLHNMRTLGAMPRHKQLKIAAETNFIYAPLAHRLGLYAFRTEYMDLCMKITDPEHYREVAEKLAETKRSREAYIDEFIQPLVKRLDELQIKYRIIGRPKSIYSIWNKLKNKGVAFEEIYDLFAIRIVLDVPRPLEKQMCWIVYSIVTDVHIPIPERLKDWVTTPKSNGYESLHTTVIGPRGRYVEVQIRTERMDEIAERGFAAHWKYKGINGQPDVYERWLDTVREILEDPNSDAVEFLGDFRTNNLFHEEVYVFTPKGDMKVLPLGASALDFAFSIHSDVGYHCTSIRVNNKLQPMGYKLKNGDQVQILTSKNQKPSEDWLKMVFTGKAKAKIRSSLKEERRQKGEFAKESIERKLKNMKVNDIEEAVERMVRFYDYTSHVDFFFDLAVEELHMQDIFKPFKEEGGRLIEKPIAPEIKPEEPQPEIKRKIDRKISAKPRLMINGEPGDAYEFSFANCCNPVQGDEVFAYLTSNAGLKIHRASCPNAANLMANYGYRVMKAEWSSTTNITFVADLLITGIDAGRGVIESLSHEISSLLQLNIRSFNIHATEEGGFEARISLLVANTDQLYLAIKALQKLEHVSSVTRVE